MNGRTLHLLSTLVTALLLGTAGTGHTETLWIAQGPIDETNVTIRDRTPEVLVLDEAAAARSLRAAGAAVEGPFEIRDATRTFLLRTRRGAPVPSAALGALHSTPELRVLWDSGTNFLVEGELPAVLPGRLLAKMLSAAPLPREVVASARESAAPTVFDPWIDTIIAQIDSVAYFPWISRLAGAESVVVGGQTTTFTTRSSYTQQCRKAEQYVYEQFQAMGFTDVVYDPFQVGGTTARNVIATLPGATTPDEIVILCGHLDSTSPQSSTNAPGANDNASGTAAVLAAAALLVDWEFDSTIRFIAFTGEEQGLVGSEHYAGAAVANGDDIRAVVNCDMVAYFNSNYAVDIEGRTFADALMQVMNDACTAYTGFSTTLLYFAWGSDHVPFLQRNIPAFLAIETDWAAYPCYHQTCDTANRNDAGFGVEVTKACVATAAHMAGIRGPAPTTVAVPSGAIDRLVIHPNPFAASTELQFGLDRPGPVRLTVHDVAGRLVRTLIANDRPGGRLRVSWDGRSDGGTPVGGGIYFVRLRTDDWTTTERAIRLR